MPTYKRNIAKVKPCPVCNAIQKELPVSDNLTDFEFCERHYYEAREVWKAIEADMSTFANWLRAIAKTRERYIK